MTSPHRAGIQLLGAHTPLGQQVLLRLTLAGFEVTAHVPDDADVGRTGEFAVEVRRALPAGGPSDDHAVPVVSALPIEHVDPDGCIDRGTVVECRPESPAPAPAAHGSRVVSHAPLIGDVVAAVRRASPLALASDPWPWATTPIVHERDVAEVVVRVVRHGLPSTSVRGPQHLRWSDLIAALRDADGRPRWWGMLAGRWPRLRRRPSYPPAEHVGRRTLADVLHRRESAAHHPVAAPAPGSDSTTPEVSMMSRTLSAVLVALALGACADGTAPAPVPIDPTPPPAPLQFGTWQLASAEGQSMPAAVAHRTVDGLYEQVFADSVHLEVLPDSSWTQRVWLRTVRGTTVTERTAYIDTGRWRADGSRWRLASAIGPRALVLDPRVTDELQVQEPLVRWTQGTGLVVGRYVRRAPPSEQPPPGQQPPGEPAVTWQRFRAADVAGAPLPAVAYVFSDEPAEGNATEFRLDSAEVRLSSDGRYEQAVWYSEWHNPNPSLGMGWGRVMQWRTYDRGTFTRNGDAAVLVSGWIQNRAMTGEFHAEGIRLRHGLGYSDPNLYVGYAYRGVMP